MKSKRFSSFIPIFLFIPLALFLSSCCAPLNLILGNVSQGSDSDHDPGLIVTYDNDIEADFQDSCSWCISHRYSENPPNRSPRIWFDTPLKFSKLHLRHLPIDLGLFASFPACFPDWFPRINICHERFS